VKARAHRRTSLLGWAVVALLALGIGQAWLPVDLSPANSVVAQLPDEERRAIEATIGLIKTGGPFAYAKDGSEFGNREGHLPQKGPGCYREYTVETAGSSDRGTRRIVTGRNGEIYYTRDHYQTFVRIE
jgi:ribonuclease T1